MPASTTTSAQDESASGPARQQVPYTVQEPGEPESSSSVAQNGNADGEGVQWDERLILELPPDADKEEVQMIFILSVIYKAACIFCISRTWSSTCLLLTVGWMHPCCSVL